MLTVSLLLALPSCGGTFCNAVQFQPVIQTGEGIVFFVDRNEGTVDAIINIQYEGSAPEFAWVLPLQSAPASLKVAPQFLFSAVDQLTAPQFVSSYETRGTCEEQQPRPSSGGQADASGLSDSGAADTGPSGVQVLFRGAVGPYDSVVIQSSDPAEMRTWLEDNGYLVTDEMMEAVIPYVTKGDALLALKLLNGKSAGDIQPIWVTMQGNEVCVPIRLTAIAAVDDMDITTTVLSNEGRAIPENYFHVELNLPRIDWINGGGNYRQLVADAADEGSGNAFVTEYSGSARIFDSQINPGQYNRENIEGAPADAGSVINQLQLQSLTIHPEVAAALLEAIGEARLLERGITGDQFLNCPGCFAFNLFDVPLDPVPIAESVWSRVVQPLQDLQREFDGFTWATRLYTLISPDEMTIDPEFAFRTDLPNVSNIHRARVITDCSRGGRLADSPLEVHIEETGQIVALDRVGGSIHDEYLDGLPASVRIEQLAQGLVVEDHRAYVDSILDGRRQQVRDLADAREPSACGCSAVPSSSSWLAGLFALALITGGRRIARRLR